MDIPRYLKKTNQTQADFARKLDCAPSYVSTIIAQKQWPTRRFMARVLEVTGGLVTPNDLFGADEIKSYQQGRKR